MRTFRRLMIASVAIAALLVAAPALAQTTTTQATPAQTTPPPAQVQKQQGLGVFLQGGYVRSSTYSSGGTVDLNLNPQGVIFGIGFGGNKSGAFGVGVDLNYVWKTDSDDFGNEIRTQTLSIPVYGRFNIGGHNTKNAPTFFIPVGWFFDVLLSSKASDGTDTLDLLDKEIFNGFQTGPLVGAGFEVARIAVEGRFQWALMDILTKKEIDDFGGVRGKEFSFVLLFKVRLN